MAQKWGNFRIIDMYSDFKKCLKMNIRSSKGNQIWPKVTINF